MAKLRVHNLAMSIDGYVAGPDQSRDDPLGVGGLRLHEWVFETRSGRAMIGQEGGSEELDDEYLRTANDGVGATVMGRNMFGPIRGPWGDDPWSGWWGDDPPYHHPVFVLTHHARPPIVKEGGTTFHFVTGGIEAALEAAVEAAAGADVRLGGGASTVAQYLRAGLVDVLGLALVPVLLEAGERIFDDMQGALEGFACTGFAAGDSVLHATFTKPRAGA
ncbi:MAG TPA: dihydrofolate reductase family protein [Actinomycetota bacterium]|nr:dihydrofolate reductase family protein [Actinomycetota bacterium]